LGSSEDATTPWSSRTRTRIGIDRPDGAAVGLTTALAEATQVRSYPTANFADLARQPGAVVLDVRRDDERARGHIPGSAHIPLHTLVERVGGVPAGRLWVHCASGYRAGIAASLLDRAGHEVVLVDDDVSHAQGLMVDGRG
jgi:hydroxyacylglutathione hydrolase